jgi:tetraacyldisaccharide 4'-kinase
MNISERASHFLLRVSENRLFHIPLWALSKIYLSIITVRHFTKRKKGLHRPVISVGNIVLGGTGKTPAVEMLARILTTRECRVAILSRGYRRKPTRDTASFGIVSDGKTILLGSEEGGDEPQLLAKNLPGVAVLVGKNRFLTGNLAINKYGCDAIILDDGYQYSALKRDLNIAVVNANCPFGNGYLIPRGALREPKNSLKRANLFLLTHIDESNNLESLKQELKSINPTTPIIESVHSPVRLQDITTEKHLELNFLAGKDIFALSSIGNPQSFEKTLKNLGANVQDSFRFLDHHRYSPGEIDKIRRLLTVSPQFSPYIP